MVKYTLSHNYSGNDAHTQFCLVYVIFIAGLSAYFVFEKGISGGNE
jgi:hypothetical protein